jgi:ADP-ribose pyrophosphatase YjhB (NUDIX family)
MNSSYFDSVSYLKNMVLSATTYNSLPDRIIVSVPFYRKHFVSYGIIAYCKLTKRWLLIRPKYTYYFITYLSGNYRKADLSVLISGMTKRELDVLRKLYNGTVFFEDVYKGYTLKQSKKRFEETRDILRPYLYTFSSKIFETQGSENTPFAFPKGRLNSNETSHECAIREFVEETGLSLNNATCVSFAPITEKYTSFDQYVYETKFWIYTFEEEPKLDSCSEQEHEIEERKWCNITEATSLLDKSKLGILYEAKKILKIN